MRQIRSYRQSTHASARLCAPLQPSTPPSAPSSTPQSMIQLSRTQDEEVGDGTTSVIILAGELLQVGP
jgi:hypothetical protein